MKTGGGQQQEDIQDSKQIDTKDIKQLDTKDSKQLDTNNIKQIDTNNIKQLDTKDIKHSDDTQTKKLDNVTGDKNNDSHNCVDSIGGTPTGHKILTETSLVEESQTKDGEQAETESNTNASKGRFFQNFIFIFAFKISRIPFYLIRQQSLLIISPLSGDLLY